MPKKPVILHVDDDYAVRELVAEALGCAGMTVRQESEVLDAIRSALRERPDVVLLDLHIPGADGYEACVAFRNVPELADIPIVMLTGMHDEEHRKKAFACGVTDFLAKPFDTAKLVAAIKKQLSPAR